MESFVGILIGVFLLVLGSVGGGWWRLVDSGVAEKLRHLQPFLLVVYVFYSGLSFFVYSFCH